MKKQLNYRREQWMKAFENVLKSRNARPPMIDWNLPIYDYLSGKTAQESAERYMQMQERENRQ